MRKGNFRNGGNIRRFRKNFTKIFLTDENIKGISWNGVKTVRYFHLHLKIFLSINRSKYFREYLSRDAVQKI